MTIEAAAVTVATTPTLLATGGHGAARTTPGSTVTVKPAAVGQAEVYVGPADVATTTGLPLGGGISFGLEDDEALYGIVASGTVVVRVLEHG